MFSAPPFGDFLSDAVCRVRLGAAAAKRAPLADLVAAASPGATIADVFGNVLGTKSEAGVWRPADDTPETYSNLVRYCEYPGNAMFSLVKFEVCGNPLDQYDEAVPIMLEKFTVPPGKRRGYNTLVGQENPLEGFGALRARAAVDRDAGTPANRLGRNNEGQSNQSVAFYAGTALDGKVWSRGVVGAAAPVNLNPDAGAAVQNQFDISREGKVVYNGPQTPKPVQPALEVWNKLHLWFCNDVRYAVSEKEVPYGQRFFYIRLADTERFLFESPSVYQWVGGVPSPLFKINGVVEPEILAIELYVNNLFVNSEVCDIYDKTVGMSLIRVWRQQRQVVREAPFDKLLSQMKGMTEYMWVGLRPAFNVATPSTSGVATSLSEVGGNVAMWRDWHRLTRQVAVEDSPTAGAAVGRDATPDEYWVPVPSVDKLMFTAHGITIHDIFSDTFYNAYVPFQHGATVTTPSDPGALFVNMSLHPREYQPSGYHNFKALRESYLSGTSAYITPESPAELIVVATTINMLIHGYGHACIRYNT